MTLCENTPNCGYFAYYPPAQWCNMTTDCGPTYQTSGTQGKLFKLEAPPAGGISACR